MSVKLGSPNPVADDEAEETGEEDSDQRLHPLGDMGRWVVRWGQMTKIGVGHRVQAEDDQVCQITEEGQVCAVRVDDGPEDAIAVLRPGGW